MASPFSFWQFEDELRGLVKTSEDQKWNIAASHLAFADQMRFKSEKNTRTDPKRVNNDTKPWKAKFRPKGEEMKIGGVNQKPVYEDWKMGETGQKSSFLNGVHSANGNGSTASQVTNTVDKRFKSLPPTETLPRNETLGGYIFVCNNDTMQEDLKRQLFGLPQRYRDSVRAIQPGLPLFLYNYTTHQLHGVFEAASFGGSNIDPTAWENKKCKGESRFPAQVRIRVRKLWQPLEEDSFRPVLHHYDGPKFRLQLSIPETLALLDLFTENESLIEVIGQSAPMPSFRIYNLESSRKGPSPYLLASGVNV